MNTRFMFKTQSVIRLIVMGVACLSGLAPILVFAETNEVERAMVTDSDGDGMTDWEEWQAGTNPGDPTNCLAITKIAIEGDKIVLSWKSVDSSTYQVVSAPTVTGLTSNPHPTVSVTAVGGVGPWNETISTATNDFAASNLFFHIRLVVPQDFDKSTVEMATFE